MKKIGKRSLIIATVVLLTIAALVMAFRSPAVLVEAATASRGHFQVTVEDEGRTRVKDRFDIAAPVNGHMSRLWLEPGDKIQRGDVLLTIQAAELDPRSRAQAKAGLLRAESALQAASAQVELEAARAELAAKELQRLERLVAQGHISNDAIDRARAEERRASAALRSARFAVDVALHEQEGAQAALSNPGQKPLQITAPVSGTVLTRRRQSEGAVSMGEVLMTVGDTASLEVEVDLLSSDAVRLKPGMRVELERWGGDEPLAGSVERVEPAAFTKYSALGVEEQRVWVIVNIVSEPERWRDLGDAYRAEARFVVWEGDDVLQIPSSALFREGDRWLVYVIESGEALLRPVERGRRVGLVAEIKAGLAPGEQVVLHPGNDIRDGSRVKQR